MSYVLNSLEDDEEVEYDARLSRFWFWTNLVFAVLCIPLLGVGLLLLGNLLITVFSTEMVITSRRVIHKTGLIRRHVDEISLAKVESVHANQGIWERIIGSGTVAVRGTGAGVINLKNLDDPMDFRREVLKAVENYGERRRR